MMKQKLIFKIGNFNVFVDAEDAGFFDRYHWWVRQHHRTFYAHGRLKGLRGGKSVRLHRMIMGARQRQIVDHINGNGLDNTRSNLRFVNSAQNAANRANCKHKGYERLPGGSFRAKIRNGRKTISLGTFATEAEASAAYSAAYIYRLAWAEESK